MLWINAPDPLDWIDGFFKEGGPFDIGANIGLNSASTLVVKIDALEPFWQNYGLLALDINPNLLDGLISAYPIICQMCGLLCSVNILSMNWDSALSSFDSTNDRYGNPCMPVFRQGFIGMSRDDISGLFGGNLYVCAKVDVDGSEFFVLKGAASLPAASGLKTVLVGLSQQRSDHEETPLLSQVIRVFSR